MTLSSLDRGRIEGQAFEPAATIAFHEIIGCLVWSDEVPDGLSTSGHEYIRDLLAARGYLHRGVPAGAWEIGSTDLLDRWREAQASGLRWNGFRRLDLTPAERAVLERYLADQSEL